MDFAGWTSIDVGVTDPRWVAVKDSRVPAIAGLKSVHDIHIWTRRNVAYEADKEDRWAQPFETLGWGKGDCEDIAILERALLIAAGWPSKHIWLVLAHDLVIHEVHALLIFERFLIDSRSDRIAIAAKAKDYVPVLAFCDDRAAIFRRGR